LFLRLVTRKDVKALKLEDYLIWVLEVMDTADSMLWGEGGKGMVIGWGSVCMGKGEVPWVM
jgi:hypothetical protein